MTSIIDLNGSGKTLVELILSINHHPSIVIRKSVRNLKTLKAQLPIGTTLEEAPDMFIFEIETCIESLSATALYLQDILRSSK